MLVGYALIHATPSTSTHATLPVVTTTASTTTALKKKKKVLAGSISAYFIEDNT